MTTDVPNAVVPSEFSRPANPEDAELVHKVYCAAPRYFEIISIPDPSVIEVRGELEAAFLDKRRFTELLFAPDQDTCSDIIDPQTGRQIVGYLDYKLDYPDAGDGTVNLLLIIESLQSKGLGRHFVNNLESRLRGQVKRLLASIYGQNHRAERFWKTLGYSFAIDAKPVLDWYAKTL
ncbi:MAG: GNAT family N-acetyltransferase [Trueperaceae bacterium]|nr:GNAT family N-acetyltransferase [Trueperaceae bacterium]